MILMRACPHGDCLQQDRLDGQTVTHLGGIQHAGLEHVGRQHIEGDGVHSVLTQLCASIFLRTGQEMWPGRQPHLNWKKKTMSINFLSRPTYLLFRNVQFIFLTWCSGASLAVYSHPMCFGTGPGFISSLSKHLCFGRSQRPKQLAEDLFAVSKCT